MANESHSVVTSQPEVRAAGGLSRNQADFPHASWLQAPRTRLGHRHAGNGSPQRQKQFWKNLMFKKHIAILVLDILAVLVTNYSEFEMHVRKRTAISDLTLSSLSSHGVRVS